MSIRLLYGTGNPAKLDSMRRQLEGTGIELLGLRDMPESPVNVDESGRSPLENARIKALTYYKQYGVPVFSCDSGLYIQQLPEELQPGTHVRNVNGKRLSDEEMTDSQIEKWETKIKDALLRRDSTLGNASSSMKSIMNYSFDINGKSYSLATFGINTLGYFSADTNERGCLHIDGDEDDSNTSGNTDKLMAAINEDPEAVTSFFQQLSNKL